MMRALYDAYAAAFNWGQCYRCGIPWKWGESHTVNYTASSGLFAMCETCWQATTPEERVHYYGLLLDSWEEYGPIEEHAGATRAEILQAVREGRTWSDYRLEVPA